MDGEHAAKEWVEANFPSSNGTRKGTLILAYGAGFDAGMAEAQDIIRQFGDEFANSVNAYINGGVAPDKPEISVKE